MGTTLDLTRPWRIGLCWAGSPQHKNDANRSLPTRALDTLFDVGGRVEYVSLQKGAREDEYPQATRTEIADFLDTANVIADLDMVVTVDTSVAHLAGAMGKPTLTLIPAVPDFRWMIESETTPWYASMRLVRQDEPGTWTGAITRVRQAIAALVAEEKAA